LKKKIIIIKRRKRKHKISCLKKILYDDVLLFNHVLIFGSGEEGRG
jgi:hypothetical protein